MKRDRSVILIGSGGHARVLFDALCCMGVEVLGVVDVSSDCWLPPGVRYLGDDERFLSDYSQEQVILVNGLGCVENAEARKEVYERFKGHGFDFCSVIHPSAIIAKDVVLGDGCQIMAGAVIQSGTQLGSNTLVNTRAGVDHDCVVENHAHVSVGSTLAGSVCVGAGAHIGAAATVIQGVQIGSKSIVAAGAVVLSDVSPGDTVVGIPAHRLER